MRAAASQLKRVEKPETWTAKDVAEFLGVSDDWVYTGVSAGEIPGFKLANRWRFDPVAVRAWYEAKKQRAAAQS